MDIAAMEHVKAEKQPEAAHQIVEAILEEAPLVTAEMEPAKAAKHTPPAHMTAEAERQAVAEPRFAGTEPANQEKALEVVLLTVEVTQAEAEQVLLSQLTSRGIAIANQNV